MHIQAHFSKCTILIPTSPAPPLTGVEQEGLPGVSKVSLFHHWSIEPGSRQSTFSSRCARLLVNYMLLRNLLLNRENPILKEHRLSSFS